MSPAAHPHLIRAVFTCNLLLYHKFFGLSSGNFAQIFPKIALKFRYFAQLAALYNFHKNKKFFCAHFLISLCYNVFTVNEREVNTMKEFFGITESSYQFSIFDVTALFTILNVACIMLGYWFAPLFGLINCGICLVINVKNKAMINSYITQVALIILNLYFMR